MYRIEGRRCEKQSLNETFRPFGLREARFFGREILGAVNPGLGVLVDGFHDERGKYINIVKYNDNLSYRWRVLSWFLGTN